MTTYTLDELNALDYEEFIGVFGNVVEHCPIAAGALWSRKGFKSLADLHENFCAFVDSLPLPGKVGILRCHPDLAGRLAEQGLLTSESSAEQAAASLHTLTPEERTTLTQLNQDYKTKFGFPFIICAKENKKDAILQGMGERVRQDSQEQEVFTAVEHVKKIAWYRLCEKVRGQ